MYSVAPKDILFRSERAEGISGEQQTLAGKIIQIINVTKKKEMHHFSN